LARKRKREPKQPKRQAARRIIEASGKVKTIAEMYKLSPRECEMLKAMTETEDAYEIALKLRISEPDVQKSIRSVKEKTGLPMSSHVNLGAALLKSEPCRYKTLSEVLECSRCAEVFSAKRFPFYPEDRRCADCIDLASISRSRKRRENVVRDLVQKIEQQVKRGHSATPAVIKVIHAFNEAFGGVAQLGSTWAQQLMILIERSPGSNLTLNQIREYAKFQFAVAQQENEKAPEQMSDEELESHEASLLAEKFMSLSDNMFEQLLRAYSNDDVLGVKESTDEHETPRLGTSTGDNGKGDAAKGSTQPVSPDDGAAVPDTHECGEAPASEGREKEREIDGGGV